MKNFRFTVFAALTGIIVAVGAFAMTGDKLASVPTPGPCPTGLTFDGKHLWIADRFTDSLYAVDPKSGNVAKTIPAPGFVTLGLTFDGEALWCIDGEQEKIYRLDPKTGITLRCIDSPTPGPQGLAWQDGDLWLSDDATDRIRRISTDDGTTIISFPAPANAAQGLTFDGTYLWCSDRAEDRIYMIEPDEGRVILSFDSPGKYARGLTWAGGALWNVDYQDDMLYTVAVDPENTRIKVADAKTERLILTHEFRNYGPGEVKSLDVYLAIPSDRPNQKIIGDILFDPAPDEFIEDRWGQKLAHWNLTDLSLAERVRHTMTVTVELASARWFIFPERVGSLRDIPREISKRYLADEDKFRINDPVIRDAVADAVGGEKHPYWIMRRLHSYVAEHLEYELVGGWNVAPALLERGTGSCSEYTFVFIAMCRAAGLPARYVGAVMLRGDDASTDEVFHRWPEVYLPGYGWVPADAQAGDKERPADVANSIGYLSSRCLITTEGGGGSEYLGWGYNYGEAWTAKGPVKVHTEAVGEWCPETGIDQAGEDEGGDAEAVEGDAGEL